MALSEEDVKSQIEQMIKFIKQEADEKAEEIKVKAEEDFNIQKQDEVETEKKKIRQDFEKKMKQVDVEKKIAYSNAINQNRLKVLKAREDVVNQVVERARAQIAQYSTGDGYKSLLQKLIVQGCLTLQEPKVVIRCRKSDEKIVRGVLTTATQEVEEKSGLKVELNVNTQNYLPEGGEGPNACSGGVELATVNGSIRCDNTLDTRLSLAFQGMLPQIRITLFGRSTSRKHLN
eukprot:c281_g1_i1.p1 GENE.c281_g1_i1~~c281_g1_i1.p1  ORF type:complete len:232 (-),score=90.41 c281_g1_i1:327-1022(-)